MGGVEDCGGGFFWSECVDGDGDVGGAVEGEAALVAGGEVGLVSEDGAGVLCAAAAGEGGGKLDFEMDENGAGGVQEQGAGGRVFNCAAAEGEDQVVAVRQADDGCVFAVAECGFAVAGEEFGDGNARFRFDDVVDVGEGPAEACGDERAGGAFARAHEAGEDDAAGWGCGGEQRFGLDWVGHGESVAMVESEVLHSV